jgi:hypothetical protein
MALSSCHPTIQTTAMLTSPSLVSKMNQAEDVEVILAHNRQYKFHSGTLARSSKLLSGMLTEQNAARLCTKAKNAGVRTRWMIELKSLPSTLYPAGQLGLVVGAVIYAD